MSFVLSRSISVVGSCLTVVLPAEVRDATSEEEMSDIEKDPEQDDSGDSEDAGVTDATLHPTRSGEGP